jgi:peptidoglycan/LPS O-acetylase OafA/YrhL
MFERAVIISALVSSIGFCLVSYQYFEYISLKEQKTVVSEK